MSKGDPAGGPRCPQCGIELPAGTSANECPRCLLKAAFTESPTGPGGTVILPPPRSPSRGLPQPGEQLGHYRIISLLGAGGMGAVFDAEDSESGRRVALKVLSHTLDLPEARERFFREGRLAASINHPNSVYVFGTEEIGGTPVITMELVSGGTLQDRVQASGPLPVGEAVDAILQVVAGLEAAQQILILHRDVKPSNCYRADDGTVKIGDFGLSISTAIRTEPALTVTGTFLGTPAFCSPEQLRGDELNARSDMFLRRRNPLLLAHWPHTFRRQEPRATPRHRPGETRPLPKTIAFLGAEWTRTNRSTLPRKAARSWFKNYSDLAKALAPFSSAAPTPATLGLRAVAGLIDVFLLTSIGTAVTWFAIGNPLELLNLFLTSPSAMLVWLGIWLTLPVLYYALFESRVGATPGKLICQLRVVERSKNPPPFGERPFARSFTSSFRCSHPGCSMPQSLPWATPCPKPSSDLLIMLFIAVLFSTARRRNGFAAIHDLLTGIRVVSRTALLARPTLSYPETPPTDAWHPNDWPLSSAGNDRRSSRRAVAFGLRPQIIAKSLAARCARGNSLCPRPCPQSRQNWPLTLA